MTPPAVGATPAATVTVTPTSAPASTVSSFAITVTGGTGTASDDKASRVAIDLPSGYSVPSVTPGTMSSPWTVSFDSANAQIVFTSGDNTVDLADGQTLKATLSARTPSSPGPTTFVTSAFKNKNAGGTGNSASTGANPAVSITATSQAITFGALPGKTYGDPDFSVSATGGGSGNPVTFTAAGQCSAGGTNGATIHLTGAGSCDVTAHQAAGGGYTAAPDVTQTFAIAKAAQTIDFPAISTKTYGDSELTLSATGGGSGNPVTYAASGSCSVASTSLSLTGAGTCTVTADQAGNSNYLAAPSVSRTFTINKASSVMTLSGLNHVYNGSPQGATVTTSPAGLTGVTVTYDGASTVPTHAGSYAVVATLDNPNYAAEQATGTLVIDKKPITGTFTVSGRDYDGTTAATVTDRSLSGVVAGDTVSLTGGTATFDKKDAGLRTATLSGYSLSGSGAGDYDLTSVSTTTATIAKLSVTGTIKAGDKTYDGTDAATVIERAIVGKIASDDVDLDATGATFNGVDAGPHSVTAAIALTGGDKDNYALSSTTASANATIWAKELTGSWTAKDKVYDGNTGAQVKTTSLPGVVGSEDVTLIVTGAAFDTKDVGMNKVVNATLSLGGADKANYTLANAGPSNAHADISAKVLSGTIVADDKVYDGNTDAVVTPDITGVLDGETVTVHADNATFADKNVGDGKTVTADLSIDGTGAGNYSVNATATTTANITSRTVDGSFTAGNKVYDGTTTAAITGRDLAAASGDTGKITGDKLSLTGGTASFADKNLGDGKTVTGTGFDLTGDDAGNYTLGTVPTTTANITVRHLTGSFTSHDKVYDGNNTATITDPTLHNVVNGENVTLDGGSATFDSKNVGTWDVTLTGATLGGTDKGNYTLDSVTKGSANITVRHLTGSFTSHDKVYDGNNTATITDPTLHNVVNGENVTLDGGSATFDSKNVGTWDVTLTGATLGGTDKGNYILDSVTKGSADITAKDVTGSFTANDKQYDRSTTATVKDSPLSGKISGDDVSLEVTGPAFADWNAGTGKDVTGSLSLTGSAAGNYHLTNPGSFTTQADIWRKPITGSFTANNKVWDGTTTATIASRSLDGVISGDVVSMTGGTATFADANVGNGKIVSGDGFTLAGTDASNYTLLPGPWSTTASITPLYSGKGFYQPVDMPTVTTPIIWNTIKGGQTVPLKFEMFNAQTGVEQTALTVFGADATSQAKAFSAQPISCSTGDSLVASAIDVVTTGGTSLRYDTTAGQYIQNWKTPTAVGSCYRVSVVALDGTSVGPAYFKITK